MNNESEATATTADSHAATQPSARPPSFHQESTSFAKQLLDDLRARISVISKSTPPQNIGKGLELAVGVTNHRIIQLNALHGYGLEQVNQWVRTVSAPRPQLESAKRDMQALVSRLCDNTAEAWRRQLREARHRAEAAAEAVKRPKEDYRPEPVRPIRVGLAGIAAKTAAQQPASATTPDGSMRVQFPRRLPVHRPVRFAAPKPAKRMAKCTYVDDVKGKCGNWCLAGKDHCRHHTPEKLVELKAKRAAEAAVIEARAKRKADRLAASEAAAQRRLDRQAARAAGIVTPRRVREPGQKRIWTAPSEAERCTYEGGCNAFRKKGCTHCAKHDPQKLAETAARRAAAGLTAPAEPRQRRERAATTVGLGSVKGAAGEFLLPLIGRKQFVPATEPVRARSANAKGWSELPSLALTADPAAESPFEKQAATFAAGVENYFRKRVATLCAQPPQRFDVKAAGHEAANAVASHLRHWRQASLEALRARCALHIDLWVATHPGNETVASYAAASRGLIASLAEQYDQSFARALVRDEQAIDQLFASSEAPRDGAEDEALNPDSEAHGAPADVTEA